MASGEDRVLRFISIDNTRDSNLRRASEACKKFKLDTEWISSGDLKNLDLKPKKSVFVLERFEGEDFELLKENACSVVGPQCLLSCLKTETALPNLQYPVYSVAMRGAVVTCTSVPRQERDQLYDLIKLMGGTVSKDFTNSVTHLVAGEVGSQKYRVACNVNKPILLPEWVYTCWDMCRNDHICATDEEFMKLRCPTFKGITLCVTGIEADRRKEIKRLVTDHGGTYSGELNMNTCTHLLVDTPKGEKYEFARRWNLHCVCTQWFYDSVKSGFCLDEADFYTLPDDENNSSQAGRRVSYGLIKGNSAVPSKTNTDKKIANKAAEAAYKSAQKHGDNDLLSNGNKKSLSNQSKRFDNVSRLGETRLDDTQSSDFDVRLQPGNMFLDGCKIYLSGFSGHKLEKLRKIINCGGGTRFNQINEIVSHVVIGDRIDADLDLLRNCDFQGFVVTVQWILDSAREGKKLSEEDYLCSDGIQHRELSPSCKENEDPEEKLLKTSTKKVAPLQKLSDNKRDAKIMHEDDAFEDDDVFQQYLPHNMDSTENNNHDTEQQVQLQSDGGQGKDHPITSTDPDATLDEGDEPEQDGGLLEGRSFIVVGFDEHIERLWQIIESNGGKRASERQMADFAIFPMNTVPKGRIQAKQLATFCWLEQSIECGHFLALDNSFLFKPFSIPKGCQPLEGCVLSISQYTGMERDHMYQLAELLGASCQEYFVRKASRNYQASTHLLCQTPDGKKYSAAVKWNLPVVSQQWLFACAVRGTLASVSEFPVSKDHVSIPSKADANPLERMTEDKSSSKESTTKDDSERTAQEEVGMETDYVLSTKLPALPHKKENMIAVNADKPIADGSSALKQPIKRPSIYSRPFRPSFDLADVMEELQSPACASLRSRKSRGSRNSFPLDDFFAENIKQTLQKFGTVAPPTREGEDDGAWTAYDEQQREKKMDETNQGILAGIVLSVSKKLAQQQTEFFTLATSLGADYRWLYDESCTHLVHQGSASDKTKEYTQAKDRGIFIVSPHWLYACQEKNERVDESMYPHTFNPKLSLPVLTTGRRMTRSSKASTVEQQMSPQKKVNSAVTDKCDPGDSEQPSKTGENVAENERNEDIADGELGVAESTTEEVQCDPQMGAGTLESLEAREDFKRQLEAIMGATKGKGRRRSRRNTSSTNSSLASHNGSGSGAAANMSLATRRTSSRLKLRSKAADVDSNKSSSRIKSSFMAVTDESEHSQSDTITYDDPAGRMEREKIMAQLKRGCSPSPDLTAEEDEEINTTNKNEKTTNSKDSLVTGMTVSCNNITNEQRLKQLNTTIRSEPPSPVSSSTPAAPPIGLQIKDAQKPQPINLLDGTTLDQTETRAPSPLKFQLSVMTPQEKIDYSALIEQLGGQVFDTVYFNPDCTHVVVGKPNRNEKYLAAVAAGKWVLHKSYLEASREEGFFVDEARHEWGEEIPGEPFNKLAAAAQRWRIRLRQERAASSVTGQGTYSCGAFSGWVVLLCVDKSRQPGFKRLLEAGGAKVTGSRSPFKNTQDFSHAFLDLSKTKVEASDLSLLQSDNVWCLKPDYIAEYLMQDPPPPPQKYLLPEIAKLAEPDRPVSLQSRKRKGEDDISGGDKRARV